MTETISEYVADFLLKVLPDLLPKPVDSVARVAVTTFKEQLYTLLAQPRLKRELLEAARQAESNFHTEARRQMKNDELIQAVASFPLFDNELFQNTLSKLPDHLNEDFLSQDLENLIADDWKGKFTPVELRTGVAIYLNCLRVQLLKVREFADLIIGLAALRTDVRTEEIQKSVSDLLMLVKSLLGRMVSPNIIARTLFTILPPVQDFTGRDAELRQLKESLENGEIITCLCGGGGIGKTELARKLAQEIAGDYPDARMEINLLGSSETPLSSDEAMRRLLEPFYAGQKLPDEPEQLKGMYQQTFSAKKSLLLLDNAANVSQIRPLIPPAPSVTIITSRQHFSLTEFGLKEPLRLNTLSPEYSRELLRIATEKLKSEPDVEVDKLSKLCGYLPLALRVAASLLTDRLDWTSDHLFIRLSNEMERLNTLKRDSDQNLNVEAALQLSYILLPNELKFQFCQLAVFAAPFEKVAAQAIWVVDETTVDDSLGVLINHSLVNYDRATNAYTLHDLTRLFAQTQLLEKPGAAVDVSIRHAEYYINEYRIHEQDVISKHFVLDLSPLHRIWPHLDDALMRLLPESSWPKPDDSDKLLIDITKCSHYVSNLSPQKRVTVSQSAIAIARRLGDEKIECEHLCNLGLAYVSLGKLQEAISTYENVIETIESKCRPARNGHSICKLRYCVLEIWRRKSSHHFN